MIFLIFMGIKFSWFSIQGNLSSFIYDVYLQCLVFRYILEYQLVIKWCCQPRFIYTMSWFSAGGPLAAKRPVHGSHI